MIVFLSFLCFLCRLCLRFLECCDLLCQCSRCFICWFEHIIAFFFLLAPRCRHFPFLVFYTTANHTRIIPEIHPHSIGNKKGKSPPIPKKPYLLPFGKQSPYSDQSNCHR